ncbi:MAG TPA: ABC transporter substrate-binding protein, partial [Thermoanaerobaculia bacterium]|nr:ABC transporter substrate-binding protein [Thermoanaerobaculia bacterium]
SGVDVFIGRWIADYDDPDNFSFTLFHSGNGRMRGHFSSLETDEILEEARRESRPGVREALYRKFENAMLESSVLVPLFHDVDYRIAAPAVRGLSLRSTAPFVNYAELGKATTTGPVAAPSQAAAEGVLHVPVAGVLRSLDPSLTETVEQAEVLPNIFETLTLQGEGAVVVPWLASEVMTENNGMRFRFRLRPGVRFHDGRGLTARDVRYSYERLLQNTKSDSRWQLSPIRGARRLLDGTGSDLEGFHIVSPSEFFIDLEEPVSFFPALLSYAAAAIVPEGTTQIGGTWREGAVGTGAFRAVAFEPGRRLELERNPNYWREGYPKSEAIVFRFASAPDEIRADFLAGRLSIASDLLAADAEALRRDPRFASGYRETPRLTTYFVAFNIHHEALRDAAVRRSIVAAVHVPTLVRRTLGSVATPASGLIPPGLLGHTAVAASAPKPQKKASSSSSGEHTISRETVELTASVHPVFFGEYAAFFAELSASFREIGFQIRPINQTMAEYIDSQDGRADLQIGRWNADYPDADTFIYGLLRTKEGIAGRMTGTPEVDRLGERGRTEIDPR